MHERTSVCLLAHAVYIHLQLVAMIGAAIATCISDIPFDGPCAMTQIGMTDGEFIVNPSQEQWKNGDLNLTC